MLASVNRKQLYSDLKSILGVRSWKQSQVSGLDAFFDAAERDPLIPAGTVGVQRAAYWLKTMAIETAGTFQPIHEYGGRAYFIKRYGPATRKGRELGNDTEEEAVAYSGVGLVQTTGENNVERLEAFIREHYPWIAEAVERDTGKPFDLTIGDQPDDRSDVENMTRFDVAYVALVAGTTYGFYGPPLSRYINERICDYRDARRSVNGTDRAAEFARECPKIEKALTRAMDSGAASTTPDDGATAHTPGSVTPDPATSTPSTPPGPADTSGPTTNIQSVGQVTVEAPTPPVKGGAAVDPPAPIVEKWWDTAKGIPSKVYGALTAGGVVTFGLLSEAINFVHDNRTLVLSLAVIAAVVAVGLYLMHMRYQRNLETQRQQFEMQKLMAQIAADPMKINVGMKSESDPK